MLQHAEVFVIDGRRNVAAGIIVCIFGFSGGSDVLVVAAGAVL